MTYPRRVKLASLLMRILDRLEAPGVAPARATQSLMNQGAVDNVSEPRPTASCTPKYS